MDNLDTVFRSYIGRIVAFALAPLLGVAAAPAVKGINDVLGTGYTEQQLSNIAIGVGVGVALGVWQWLRNRGNWEAKLAELEALYRAGAELAEPPVLEPEAKAVNVTDDRGAGGPPA